MPHVLDAASNPVIGRHLRTLRCVERQKDPAAFRGALREIGRFMAYEIAKTLDVTRVAVKTPLGEASEPVLAETPVLVTVLRASLPMWEGMLDVFGDAPTIFVGAARREGTPADGRMEVDTGYTALAPVEGRTMIYVDPMVATGSTITTTHADIVRRAGSPRRVIVAGAIGYEESARRLEREIAHCETWLAAADRSLNEKGYIVPGLGDAGDLAFGPKLH